MDGEPLVRALCCELFYVSLHWWTLQCKEWVIWINQCVFCKLLLSVIDSERETRFSTVLGSILASLRSSLWFCSSQLECYFFNFTILTSDVYSRQLVLLQNELLYNCTEIMLRAYYLFKLLFKYLYLYYLIIYIYLNYYLFNLDFLLDLCTVSSQTGWHTHEHGA